MFAPIPEILFFAAFDAASIVLATVPIVGFIIPKTSPNKLVPFLGRPRRLFTPSHDNSGIELILLCKELVAFCNPLCPALLADLIIGLIRSLGLLAIFLL